MVDLQQTLSEIHLQQEGRSVVIC